MIRNKSSQNGQAMVEFNVTAVFLLVPLFILIPLLGKYIDMKHSSIQAARYMAWERTVWFENAPKNTSTAAVKSATGIKSEVTSRFLGRIYSDDDDNLDDDEINLLWKDNAGRYLVEESNVNAKFQNGDEEVPSKIYKGFNIATNLLDITAKETRKILIDVLDFVNDGAEAITGSRPIPTSNIPRVDIVDKFHFEGYYQSEIKIDVNNIPYMDTFDILNLEIVSRAAIITDSWTGAGYEGRTINDDEDKEKTQFSKWTKNFVPFSLARKPFSYAQSVFSYQVLGVSIAPELAGDKLIFGHIDTDPVTDSSVIPECPDGVCSFD